MSSPRHVFYISDRTGLTAEHIGESLLNQFGNLSFKRHTHPFVDTPEQARAGVETVNRSRQEHGQRPIAFVRVVEHEI
ncbi:phosphoenolpyruvate synthase regulatory protein, partial [Neisseria meningitidis]|uniref:kinase/pyrophosphorylase n=1 Tax=Neisseria meningitidis TaxID=487 RepID=UPI000CC340E1